MKTIYYAHHLWKYNTEIEKYEIDLIRKHFPDCIIINPNGDIQHENINDEEKIMDKCLSVVRKCDGLIFSSISGVVGLGVYHEVMRAAYLGIPIMHILNNWIYEVEEPKFKVIDESRRIYAVVR